MISVDTLSKLRRLVLRQDMSVREANRRLGNSAAMIERHYSKLTATLAAEQLA